MHALTGYLDFRPEERAETVAAPRQDQPYGHQVSTDHVSRIPGADTHVLTISSRRSVTEG